MGHRIGQGPARHVGGRRLGRTAVAALSVAACLTVVTGGSIAHAADVGGGGSLPEAWELCILENLGAPVNAADVGDLEVWQVAEGGSTANANTFNPFNTKRATDAAGNPLPAVMVGAGFPAFASWPAGCSATTATILQPNMAAIDASLSTGGQPVPSAFLATVDQTPWCAPDNGQPCYGAFMSLGIAPGDPTRALSLLSDSANAVSAYGHDVSQIASLEGTLSEQQSELVAAQQAVAAAQQAEQDAHTALEQLAVYDYTSNPSLDRIASLDQFETPTQTQQLSQFYERVDLTWQVRHLQDAQAVVRAAVAHTASVASAIGATRSSLASTEADQVHWVSKIASDVGILHNAGACPAVPAIPTGQPAAAGPPVGDLAACLHALV